VQTIDFTWFARSVGKVGILFAIFGALSIQKWSAQ
jgi:hypothetical protein